MLAKGERSVFAHQQQANNVGLVVEVVWGCFYPLLKTETNSWPANKLPNKWKN